MKSLKAAQVNSALRALFDQPMPAAMRCFTVLDGTVSGDILTDDAENPTWGVVRERAFGTTFFAGTLDVAQVHSLIIRLLKSGDVVIGLYADDPLITLLPTPFEYDGWAVDYTDRPLNEGLEYFLRAPIGCTIRRMDRALFKRSLDYTSNVAMFGSIKKALEHLIGFYLMRDDEILCEAVAGPAAIGMREMGVMTRDGHRQQGYGTVACAYMIQSCEQLGFQTYWNCDKNNVASNALARKLGYRKAQEYRVIAWSKLKPIRARRT